MELKKMEYSAEEGKSGSELLYYAKDKDGYGMAIVNTRHTHPCAYITFPGIENVEHYENYYIWCDDYEGLYSDCGVHYGFTFLGNLNHYGLEGKWIGWDYAHLGDYNPFYPHENDHKYTAEEVAKDVLLALTMVKHGYGRRREIED